MSKALVLTVIALTMIVALTISTGARHEALASNNESLIKQLPPGAWTLAIQPTKTRGKIVDLSSVANSLEKGLEVTDFMLENRFRESVAGVKVAWRLFETSNREATLLKGETPDFLAVPLTAGEKRVVRYPVVSFVKTYHPLLQGRSKLQGNYKIELWVSDISFATENEQGPAAFFNAKKVNWKPHAAVAFIPVKSAPAPPPVDDELGCPHQVCHYDHSELCYRCVSENGGTCGWRDCKNCANGRCPGLLD